MKRIYKYSFDSSEFTINEYVDKFLDVQMQNDLITVWAIIDTKAEPQEWLIYTFGTGWSTPHFPGEYIGTVQEKATGYVWHVFAAQVQKSVDCGWVNPEEERYYAN